MPIKSRNIILIILTVLLGLFVARNYRSAFPELSLQFSLKKSQVSAVANRMAEDLGFESSHFQQALTFKERTSVKNFLELEYGLDQLNQSVRNGVKIWYWSIRYFVPLELEEALFHLDPHGRLVGFAHRIPEEEVRPRIDRESALDKARAFILNHVRQHPFEKLRLVESGEQEKPGHHIYNFTWEREDWRWGDGRYQLYIEVVGDKVGTYVEHLKVPEAWNRDFAKKRSSNKAYQTFANAAALMLALGVVILFVRMMIRHRVRWHGFSFIWLLPIGLILLFAQLSQFPEVLASYSTENNFQSYIAQNTLRTFFNTLLYLIAFFFLAFMADSFWQRTFPKHISIRSLLSGRGYASHEAMRSIGYAFMLAIWMLAYITAYYMAGGKLGIWSPATIDYAQVLTSYFPAIEALNTGISAAWTEEFFFRVLALVLIFRVTGSKWAAIIIPAVVWGFLHSNYPQLPGYARGLELSLEGVLLGWVAFRYGILTTFLAHCLFNTWLGAFITWQTGSAIHMTTAVLVSIWPAGLWLRGWYLVHLRGRYYEPRELVKGPPTIDEQMHEVEALLTVRKKKIGWRALAGMLLIIALAGAVFFMQEPKPLVDLGKVKITRHEAERRADYFFVQHTGLNPSSYYHQVERYHYLSDVDADYLLENASGKKIVQLMREYLYQHFWAVHYFRAEELQSYTVFLKPDGSLMFFSRVAAETEPGPELEPETAIDIATDFLQEFLQIPPEEFHYLDLQMTQQISRRDYEITFESTVWNIGESRLRWTVSLVGDTVNDFDIHVKVPEEYERLKRAQGWNDVINDLLNQIKSIIILIGALFLMGLLIIHHHIPWRVSLLFALTILLVVIVREINLLPEFLSSYQTTISMGNFFIRKLVSIGVSTVTSYATAILLFGLLLGLVHWLTRYRELGVLFGETPRLIRIKWGEGMVMALFGVSLVWLLEGGSEYLALRYISEKGMLYLPKANLQGFSPGLGIWLLVVKNTVFMSLATGIYLLAAVSLWKKHRGLFFAVVVFFWLRELQIDWDDKLLVMHALASQLLVSILTLWLFLALFRLNPYAYLFFYYFRYLLPTTLNFAQQTWGVYTFDVCFLGFAMAAPLLAGGFCMVRNLVGKKII